MMHLPCGELAETEAELLVHLLVCDDCVYAIESGAFDEGDL